VGGSPVSRLVRRVNTEGNGCCYEGVTQNFRRIGFLVSGGMFLPIDKAYCNSPNAPTPLVVPTYTLPLVIIGVMNLFPEPN